MSQSDHSAIITSPEAEKMLQYVTRDFYSRSPTALLIFQAIGSEWDEMAWWSEEFVNEFFPQTCTWSMPFWEQEYGIASDSSLPLSVRRQKLMAKIIYRAPITPYALESVIHSFTGFNVSVTEHDAPYTFKIILCPSRDNASYDYDQVIQLIRNSKPSHLSFNLNIHTSVPFELKHPLSCGVFCHTRVKAGLIE